MRASEWKPYREGLVLRSQPGAGSYVDIGLDRMAFVPQQVAANTRVTLHLGDQPNVTFMPDFGENMIVGKVRATDIHDGSVPAACWFSSIGIFLWSRVPPLPADDGCGCSGVQLNTSFPSGVLQRPSMAGKRLTAAVDSRSLMHESLRVAL